MTDKNNKQEKNKELQAAPHEESSEHKNEERSVGQKTEVKNAHAVGMGALGRSDDAIEKDEGASDY